MRKKSTMTMGKKGKHKAVYCKNCGKHLGNIVGTTIKYGVALPLAIKATETGVRQFGGIGSATEGIVRWFVN